MKYFEELQKIGANLSILYAEDEEIVAQTTAMVLETIFKEVVIVENGQKGLEAFKKQKIDLIITDLKMPVMDGYEFCQKVKKNNPSIPVVIFSGFINEEMKQKFKESKVYYIKKPFKPEIFFETLHEICQFLKEE